MKKYSVIGLVVATIAGLVALGWFLIKGNHFALLQPSGEVAKHQSDLLIFAFSIMMIVVIPVFIMLVVFAWRYREGNTKKVKYDPEWSHNNKLEAIWWGIPIVIILILATTAWITSRTLDPYTPIISDTKPVEVQVVALEWKWLFLYPDLGVATINELPIPEKTPIHFSLSADAPMSAFWIPSLGSQIYTMNGMSSQLNLVADTTGEFPGYNTNINGRGYSDMTFNVYSKTKADFDKWVEQARNSKDMMDEATLAEVSKQSVMKPKTYMLMDRDLYGKIVMKYMKGMMPDMKNDDHTKDSDAQKSDSNDGQINNTQDHSSMHDMKDMEGM